MSNCITEGGLNITYKFKPPTIADAFYITILDTKLEDGTSKPSDIFVNSKNLTDIAYMTTIAILITHIFKAEPNWSKSAIMNDLSKIHDPRGEGYWDKGKYVSSLSAGISSIVETHMINLERKNKCILEKNKELTGDVQYCAYTVQYAVDKTIIIAIRRGDTIKWCGTLGSQLNNNTLLDEPEDEYKTIGDLRKVIKGESNDGKTG